MNDKNKKKILGGLAVVLLFAVYSVFFKKEEAPAGGLAFNTASQIDSTVGREIITTLNKLQTIKIDPGFFDSDLFNSLVNFHVELQEEPVGKNDPFTITEEGEIISGGQEEEESEDPGTDPELEPEL